MAMINNNINWDELKNALYPHLQEFDELIDNGDIANATKLLQHNDDLAKFLLITNGSK
jgi:hypothetical protein